MPQLDTTYFLSQVLWLIISFCGLYYILKYSVIPKIENVLESRSSKIKTDLEEAARLRDIAKSLQQDYDKKSKDLDSYISSIILATIDDITKIKADSLSDIHNRISAKEKHIIGSINAEKSKAKEEMPKYVIEHSSIIIEKTTGHKPSVSDLKKFYEAIKC